MRVGALIRDQRHLATAQRTRPGPIAHVPAEITRTNAAFKKIKESQAAFKKDAYLWAQISEYDYDVFMMQQQQAGTL